MFLETAKNIIIFQLERVQKTAIAIILGKAYIGYTNTLQYLKTLEERRHYLCLNFARKAAKSDKYQHWFVRSAPAPAMKTISEKPKQKYKEVPARIDRYKYYTAITDKLAEQQYVKLEDRI